MAGRKKTSPIGDDQVEDKGQEPAAADDTPDAGDAAAADDGAAQAADETPGPETDGDSTAPEPDIGEVPSQDDAESGDAISAELDDALSDTPATDPERETATQPEPVIAQTPPPPPARGGFFPALLGGVVAAAIGFGAAYYYFGQQNTGMDAQIADLAAAQGEQADAIAALRAELAKGPDLSAITGSVQDVQAATGDISGRLDVISGDIETLSTRLTEIEKRPISEGVSTEAIAAYETELKRLQDAVAQQRQEAESMIAQAQDMRTSAAETAQTTLRRAALTRILAALDNGGSFAPALADLQGAGQEVADDLAAYAETGVPSMADLRDAFPAAARRALAASRSNEAAGSVTGFLKSQLGARSLAPKAGNDPDAVLSRAEDALRRNALGDALAELDALPDAARAEMANWIDSAQTRQKATTAAEALTSTLNGG